MQRRAAAVSAVILLVIAAGAYAFMGAAEQPDVDLSADRSLSAGESVSLGGETYTLSSLDASGGSATFEYVNESARYTAALENESTVTYEEQNWTVSIPAGDSPSTFSLLEPRNVSQILRDDPAVRNDTVTIEGERYVVYAANGTTRRLGDYLPARERRSFDIGDELDYEGNTTTVSAIAASEVTLAWVGPKTEEISVSEGGNVTLGGTDFLAHFEPGTLQLAENPAGYEAYQEELDRQDYFNERMNGLWGIVIMSPLAAALLLALAYMPSRY